MFFLPACLSSLSARLLNNNFRLQSRKFHTSTVSLLFFRATEVRLVTVKKAIYETINTVRIQNKKFSKRFTGESLHLPSCRAVGVGRGAAGQCRLTSALTFKVNLLIYIYFLRFETCLSGVFFSSICALCIVSHFIRLFLLLPRHC